MWKGVYESVGVEVGTATGYLDLDISGFLRGLRTAQEEANKSTKSMAERISSGFKGVGSTLTSAGSTLTKGVTTPIVGLGAAVVKTGATFESSMAKVQSISGASGKDFEDLTAKAREMGATTQFSASEAAQAFQYMAMAGWDTSSMLGGISGVMDLAAASGEDLGTVSDIVTDAMTAFGMAADGTSKVLKDGVETEVNNTTRFVDALAAASNSSNTNVAMLGESFKYVAPVAGALSYSVEDTAVALGLMANQGIKASQAGTSLRTLLTNMANPTDTMASAMDALGVSLENDDGSMKSLMEVMQDLREGFGEGRLSVEQFESGMQFLNSSFDSGKITEEEYESQLEDLMIAMYGVEGAQKAQIAAQLAGKTGMAGLLAIINTTDEDFNKLSESIYNAAGTSKEMADIMRQTLTGQVKELMSAVESLALDAFGILQPYLLKAVDKLKEMVARFQELSPEQKEQIIRWVAIAAAIGPVLLILGKVTSTVGSVIGIFGKIPGAVSKASKGFKTLQTAFANVSEGFKLVRAGFPALGAEASKLGAIFGGLSTPMIAAVAAVVAVIGTLIAAFKHLWDTNEEFRQNIIAIWDGIKQKFEDFANGVKERFAALGIDFASLAEGLKAAWDGFCNMLAPVFEIGFALVSTVLGTVLNTLLGVLDVFIGLFTGNWDQVWTGVKEIFGAVWKSVSETFGITVDDILAVGKKVIDWFTGVWNSTWEAVKAFFSGIWEGIKTVFTTVVNAIKTFASNSWKNIQQTITTVFTSISNFFKTVWTAIRNTISTVVNAIKSTLQTVWNAILTLITNILNAIKQTITNVWTAIRNTITTIINAIKSTLETVWNAIKTTITNTVNAIKSTVSNVFEGMKTAVTNTVNNLKTAVTNTFNNIKSALTSTAENIRSSVSSKFESLKSSMSNAMETAKSNVTSAMSSAKEGMIRVWDGITDVFSGIGQNVIQGLINGIGSMVGKLYDSIKGALSNLVDDAKDELGIESPSKVFRDQVGRWIPPGIAEGFQSAMGKASKDMQRSFDKSMDSLGTDNIRVGIQDDMISVATSIADYFASVESRLADSVARMRESLEYLIQAGSMALNGSQVGYIGYGGFRNPARQEPEPKDGKPVNGSGGNTYVFYTTKAINEIEAAKLMRRTERDMAEGFA